MYKTTVPETAGFDFVTRHRIATGAVCSGLISSMGVTMDRVMAHALNGSTVAALTHVLYLWVLLNDFKRGSVQPGCILRGLRFWSTTIRLFKFVRCF
jgi:hypothetical protein